MAHVRATFGLLLCLVSTVLVGVGPTPGEAATACDDGAADTTWVGPATESGSVSWSEPANWTNGVPSATSHVCIPSTAIGPRVPQDVDAVADVIDADGATVTIRGRLAVGTAFNVAALVGDFGELHGPGTTTVTHQITGYVLTLREAATVAMRQDASIGGQLDVVDGSRSR